MNVLIDVYMGERVGEGGKVKEGVYRGGRVEWVGVCRLDKRGKKYFK